MLIAAALGMASLLSLLPAAGHDQIWFLLMAKRWLGGAVLYGPSLFDSNPPLIVWLSAIPVSLAQYLHLPPTSIGKLLTLLALLLSANLSLRLLRHTAPLTRAQTLWLTFAAICIFTVVPARDLGQRDHLTAILCLPYILAATITRSDSSSTLTPTAPQTPPAPRLPLRILIGLLAAIGIGLKPHQALIPIAVELTRILTIQFSPASLREPRWRLGLTEILRPEPTTILLSSAAYLLLIHRYAPAYFTLALPTLHDTYWAIGHLTPLHLLAEAPQLHLLAAITLALVLTSRSRRPPAPAALIHPEPLRRPILLLLAAALAATLAYYLQGTGWYYQQLPAISLFAAALALHLLDYPAHLRIPTSPWLPRAIAAIAVLALALTAHFTSYPFTPDRAFAIFSPDPAFFRDLPPGTPIAILSTSVDDTMMPVARYHLLWAQRTNNLWTLPAILRSENSAAPRHTISPARLADLDRQQHAWMVEDLNQWQPRLVLVARCQAPEVHCQELEDRHDNLLAWFNRDPAFRTLWQQSYRYLRTSGPYDAYTRTN